MQGNIEYFLTKIADQLDTDVETADLVYPLREFIDNLKKLNDRRTIETLNEFFELYVFNQ